MKKQTIILKENAKKIFGNGYRKMNPRKLLMISGTCLYDDDTQKLENLSYDLQQKYGIVEFYIKTNKNKLILIPFDDDN